jgi:hypothetical protein
MRKPQLFALSLKQPWATLLAHGIKTMEIRKWPTTHRGHVLIHAAKIADDRPEAWRHVPADLQEVVALRGGIIGSACLTGCLAYRSPRIFAMDQRLHLNEPGWFEGPIMYGFTFTRATPLPFREFPGWLRFFPVQEDWQRAELQHAGR